MSVEEEANGQHSVASALLVGAGDLGQRIGHLLHGSGAEVWAMRRRVELLPTEFRPIEADLTSAASVAAGITACSAKFDTLVFVVTADERTAEAYQQTYVGGLEAVLATVEPQRLVVVSSTAVYHQASGEWVDETSPASPTSFSGQTMLAMEAVAAAHSGSSAAVRLAGVYGPGRERLIDQVRQGEATVESTPSYTNRIHVADAAALVAQVAGTSGPVPPVVIGVDDDPADKNDVLAWLAHELEAPAPEAADTSDTNSARNANKRCSNTLARSLGWEPQYPTFREGYRSILAGA